MSKKKRDIPNPIEALPTGAIVTASAFIEDQPTFTPPPRFDMASFPSLSAYDRAKVLDAQTAKECTYIRFHQPVPRKLNEQPVSELKTSTKDADVKYRVERILLTPNWAIVTCDGETTTIPIATVHYARP